MAGLFGGKPKMPPPPKPQRMPVETDPAVRDAERRMREDALRRHGRLYTIMTGGPGENVGAGPGMSTDESFG